MTVSTTERDYLRPSRSSVAFEPKRIVFVEDEDNDVILVRHAFEKSGLTHDFVVLEDSRSAIEYLQSQPQLAEGSDFSPPDMVILDLKLVGSSGFDVLVWIGLQPALRGIPVIVFSSSWVESDVERALQLGAAEYTVKPSGFEDLMEWAVGLHSKWLCGPKRLS